MNQNGSFWSQVYSINGDIVSRHIAGETILVPVRGKLVDMEKIFFINHVGEFIWAALDGKTSLETMVGKVVSFFEVTEATARADILQFTSRLLEKRLIVANG